jgi:hypothetical protein
MATIGDADASTAKAGRQLAAGNSNRDYAEGAKDAKHAKTTKEKPFEVFACFAYFAPFRVFAVLVVKGCPRAPYLFFARIVPRHVTAPQ